MENVGKKNKRTRKYEGQNRGIFLNWLVRPMITDEEKQAGFKER